AFAKKGLFYEEAAVWKVLPALDAYVPPTALWPPSARRIEAPNLVKLGDIHIDAKGVSVSYNTQSADTGSGLLRYREDHYAFSSPQKLTLPSAPDRTIETDAVDPRCFRVELNDDEAIDLISVDVIGETAPPLSVPIVEVRVSTDAGKTFFSARSYGAEPWRPVTDYNGDGRLDLVLENKRLVEGGIRETLVRGLTRREVDLDISVWLQDASGVFPAKPSFTNSFTIELDRPPAYRSRMFENFVDTGLLLLDGDFDGDGIRDAAIQNRPDQITIRKGGPQGISSSVLTTLGIPTGSEFEIADVDGDGRADVVVTGPPSTKEGASEATTVYLSRETAP
ncbi:MAG: VCBS repeat-containing protein, partial [Candidatus Hydrogenedentes bacterium]|nr:VCBS repeat-containing protein [Candidatus Hydrogenedentota bacterium]